MTWTQTASGRAWDLLQPYKGDVHWDDIAHHLARMPRFAGAILPAHYSIAEHSFTVAKRLPADLALYGLLHDAHEAYLGDWITPVKTAVRTIDPDAADTLARLEEASAAAIHDAAGLAWPPTPEVAAAIRRADLEALATERHYLLSPAPYPWAVEVEAIQPSAIRPGCLPPDAAKRLWLEELRCFLPAERWQ